MKEYKQFNETPKRKAEHSEVCPHWPKTLVSRIYGKYETSSMDREYSNATQKAILSQ
jgi:hypothetical protein